MNTVIEYLVRVATYPRANVAIELFAIGMVVYWAMNFLEGTRGERLFRGVIIILFTGSLVLKLLIGQFELERLQYLYSGFLFAVLVIAVAGFQPEFRRMLIHIGQAGTFLSSSHQQRSRTVEEIISAVVDMSSRKIGAIIVIERKVALGELIETGVRLDSRIRAVMLKTIFHPGSPLHDMAVIIRGEQIAAARVQLPLAEAESVSGTHFGSRHRAAIGITKSSDALVIVVSEETGIISLAENGLLCRGVSESDLRKQLTSVIVVAAPTDSWFHFNWKSKSSEEKQE